MCEIDLGGDGYCEVWKEKVQTARKPYKCQSCGLPIKPGDKYLYHFDVFKGESCTVKICLACNDDRSEFQAAHDVQLNPFGWAEFLSQCIYDGDEDGKRWEPMLKRFNQRYEAAKAE